MNHRRRHSESEINLSSEESHLSTTVNDDEGCKVILIPIKKLRFVMMITAVVVLVFITGLVVGFFANLQSCAEIQQHETTKNENALASLLHVLNKKEIRENNRYFSSEPHFAGTQRSKDLADEIKKRWKSYGFHVETLAYKVLLPRAKDGRPDFMEIRDQNGNIVLKHAFAAVGKADPTSETVWTVPRFFFYGPSGQVQGGLIYANKGEKDDFNNLKNMNITSCTGSVVLMKSVNLQILNKIQNAYECNATGVLLYDPLYKPSESGPVYPNGTTLPEEQPMVRSLRKTWDFGDPLTPDLPATDGIYRLENPNLPVKIPVQLVENSIAMKLLQQLEGESMPEEWKPDNKSNYRVGPLLKNNATLYLAVSSQSQMTTIYDVIGTVYGKEEPDSWVLIGNHRDAIAFGAIDSGSGTSGMLELSRGIGEILKTGWKPRRTLKFCSWGAEEVGLLGSIEYVEDNRKLLQQRAVAYINMDMLVHGNDSLKVSGNPMLANLVYSQAKLVSDPHRPDETLYSTWKKGRPDKINAEKPQYYTLGLGSDYIAFYEIAGIPTVDLQYGKVPFDLPRAYHTIYDTYHMSSLYDPNFEIHLAQTKYAGRILYGLSNAVIVPFQLSSFASTLRGIINRTRTMYEKELKAQNITLNGITNEMNALQNAVKSFESGMKSDLNSSQITLLNSRLISFNKYFMSPEPIPSRFLCRNLVFGIPQSLQYPNITLAGVTDTILIANRTKDWEMVKRQISLTQHAIRQARKSLEMP